MEILILKIGERYAATSRSPNLPAEIMGSWREVSAWARAKGEKNPRSKLIEKRRQNEVAV